MADIKPLEERSMNMSKIRATDTKPEVWLRKQLFRKGLRYRKNEKKLPGTPDIWIPKFKTAVFINGCFWHRHNGCKYAYCPKSNVDFWQKKFEANIKRDAHTIDELRKSNIRVITIWECTVKSMKRSADQCNRTINDILCFLQGDQNELEI